MADKERRIFLDLFARDKTGPGTRGAAKNLDHVADSADDARKNADKLGDEIRNVERELVGLAAAFAKSGDAAERLDISKAIRRTQTDLRRLKTYKGLLGGILPDPAPAAKSFMSRFAAGIAASAGELAAVAGELGVPVGVAIAVAAAPTLAATLGSALSAGAGGLGIGAAIALAVKGDERLQQAGKQAGEKFVKGLQVVADKHFQGPILESIGMLGAAGERVTKRWDAAFAVLAPHLKPLTQDVITAGEKINGSLAAAAERSGPALKAMGDAVVLLGDGVSHFIDAVADGGPEAADNIRMIAGATSDLIKVSGDLLGWLDKISSDPWITGPLLPWLRKHYRDAARGSDELGSATERMAGTMSNAEKAALGQRDALAALSNELKAETDPVFGLLDAEDRLAAAHRRARQATREHGAQSREAKESLRELAKAALDVEGRAGALAKTFNGRMTPALRDTLRAAGMTESEIAGVARQFRTARRDGDRFAKKYEAEVRVRQFIQRVNPMGIASSAAQRTYEQTMAQIRGHRAAGGPVRKGHAYVVGERRPEVFVPDRDGQIMSSIERYTTGRVGAARSGGGQATVRLELDGEAAIVALVRRLIRTHNLLQGS